MKTRFFLLLGLVSTLTAPVYAQSRFSVGPMVAPVLDYGHSNYTFTWADQTGQALSSTFDQRQTRSGFTAGLSAKYVFTAHWSVSAGFGLNVLVNTETDRFRPAATPTRVRASTWQIPLSVNYRSSTRRLSPYFSVGAMGRIQGSTRFKSPGFPASRIQFDVPFRMQPMIGAGVAYRLTSQWSLTAQPVLIWQFQPQSDDYIRYNRFVSYQLQGQVQLLYSLR